MRRPEAGDRGASVAGTDYPPQILATLVDKGIALQRVTHALGIPREQTMAIGDGLNDAFNPKLRGR